MMHALDEALHDPNFATVRPQLALTSAVPEIERELRAREPAFADCYLASREPTTFVSFVVSIDAAHRVTVSDVRSDASRAATAPLLACIAQAASTIAGATPGRAVVHIGYDHD